jgi:hypothetical protein
MARASQLPPQFPRYVKPDEWDWRHAIAAAHDHYALLEPVAYDGTLIRYASGAARESGNREAWPRLPDTELARLHAVYLYWLCRATAAVEEAREYKAALTTDRSVRLAYPPPTSWSGVVRSDVPAVREEQLAHLKHLIEVADVLRESAERSKSAWETARGTTVEESTAARSDPHGETARSLNI